MDVSLYHSCQLPGIDRETARFGHQLNEALMDLMNSWKSPGITNLCMLIVCPQYEIKASYKIITCFSFSYK